jgi:hypothetical protein
MLAWSHGHAHGRMSAETAAKEQQPSSSESLVFASVVHRKLPTTTSPTLAPTYLTLIGVTLPITQRLTTSMSKSYFLHSDALVKFRDGVASGLGTMPNGRPYTREYVIVKSVLEIVAGRRLASASVLTSSSFSLEHSLLQHLHLRRRLPTTTVIALDISYTVQMDIANQEVRYIYTSSFLSTFYHLITLFMDLFTVKV